MRYVVFRAAQMGHLSGYLWRDTERSSWPLAETRERGQFGLLLLFAGSLSVMSVIKADARHLLQVVGIRPCTVLGLVVSLRGEPQREGHRFSDRAWIHAWKFRVLPGQMPGAVAVAVRTAVDSGRVSRRVEIDSMMVSKSL